MLPFEDRYSRQRKLPEVGPRGQERLARTPLTVAPRVPGSDLFELCYLLRAGVESVTVSNLRPEAPSAHERVFRFAAPRALAVGALGALSQLRREIGLTESSP
jgi:hypothetical protein